MSNRHPISNSRATASNINQLAEQLEHTKLDSDQGRNWIYFPPGTTTGEQLRILAGVKDWKLQDEKPGTMFNEIEIVDRVVSMMNSEETEKRQLVDFAQMKIVQGAMDQHLAMLNDQHLAILAERSLCVSESAPAQAVNKDLPS
ncbi:Nn.00g085760.m01.CDS01 [Neocucurbitaria sp. VM-36]